MWQRLLYDKQQETWMLSQICNVPKPQPRRRDWSHTSCAPGEQCCPGSRAFLILRLKLIQQAGSVRNPPQEMGRTEGANNPQLVYRAIIPFTGFSAVSLFLKVIGVEALCQSIDAANVDAGGQEGNLAVLSAGGSSVGCLVALRALTYAHSTCAIPEGFSARTEQVLLEQGSQPCHLGNSPCDSMRQEKSLWQLRQQASLSNIIAGKIACFFFLNYHLRTFCKNKLNLLEGAVLSLLHSQP